MSVLKDLRSEKNVSQTVVASALGISQQAYANYESGKREADHEMLLKLSCYFGVSVDYLLGRSESNLRPLSEPLTVGGKIPVLGRVPAGVPIEAIEYVIDEIEISEKMANDGHDYFALIVTGDSMFPEYMDGDIVIVRKQETADTNDDVVAYVNGSDATIKRLIRSPKGITLRALNQNYESKFYCNSEMQNLPVIIAGIVVEQRRNR